MKKVYETPVAEKVEFCYRDQVVASSRACPSRFIDWGWGNYCEEGNKHWEYLN